MSNSPDSKRSRYSLRDRSKVKKVLFEVPEWAGKNSVNTCIIDSFLAVMCCAKSKDPSFSNRLNGQSDFTLACRTFIEGSGDIEDRKDEFIRKLFKPNNYGEFDLEGDEARMILDKAGEASRIEISSTCDLCGHQATTSNDYHYTGVKDRGMDDLLHDILTKLNRSHRCQKTELCKNEENKKKVLKTFDTTWMIPFDLSQKKFTPDKIRSLPRAVEVGNGTYRLRGVTLFGGAHYTAILYDDTHWYFYDGIETPSMKECHDIKSLVVGPVYRIKIAYYLRVL